MYKDPQCKRKLPAALLYGDFSPLINGRFGKYGIEKTLKNKVTLNHEIRKTSPSTPQGFKKASNKSLSNGQSKFV